MSDDEELQAARPDVTRAFRTGMLEGVRLVIKQNSGELPVEQTRILTKWADKELTEWAGQDDATPPPVPPLQYGA